MKNLNIGIAMIGNNNKDRNKIILPSLNVLKKKLSESHNVELKIVEFQPTLTPHSLKRSLYRSFIYWKLGRKWSTYRKITKNNIFKSFMSFIKRNIFTIFHNKAQFCKTSSIETMVTDKHIRAWNQLIEKNDYLLFFEDDAVFCDSSVEKINSLLSEKLYNKLDNYVYIDIGGGCHLDDLQIKKLEQNQDNTFIYYEKIVTNTACAYILNRKLATYFLSTLLHAPELRYIGIDWMMNELSMKLEKSIHGENIFCIHANPSFVNHGSVVGNYNPWER